MFEGSSFLAVPKEKDVSTDLGSRGNMNNSSPSLYCHPQRCSQHAQPSLTHLYLLFCNSFGSSAKAGSKSFGQSITGAELGLFLAHLCVWKQVKIASNGWAMEEAQPLCGEQLHQDLPCWEIALAGVCCCQSWSRAQGMKMAMVAHPRSKAGSSPEPVIQGLKERKSYFNILVFSV